MYTRVMEKEIWKEIRGYEGVYEISNRGRIKSLPRKGSPKVNFIKPFKRKGDRYPAVVLHAGNIRKEFLMHRLMAMHFIPNLKNKPTVNHIDGDKTNYSLSNLEWATYKENNHHAIATGLAVKDFCNNTISLDQVEAACNLLQHHFSGCVSRQLGVSFHIIRRIRDRKSWAKYSSGYVFKKRELGGTLKCCPQAPTRSNQQKPTKIESFPDV